MRPGILLYFDFAAVFRVLSPEDCKSLILALLDYARTGEVPELTGQALQAWPDFKAAADRDNENYEDKTRGKHYGGHVTSSRAAGVEPLTFEEWKRAGEPSTASASCSRASASQSNPFHSNPVQSSPLQDNNGSSLRSEHSLREGAESLSLRSRDSRAVSGETAPTAFETKRREALRRFNEI